jgi:protoheme IX farnesyltransferase
VRTGQGKITLEAPGRGLVARAGALWHDILLLSKPRITAMALLVTAFGYLIAPGRPEHWDRMGWMLLGTLLVGAGGNALNQYLERDTDRLMRRTRARPLPSGRLAARPVLLGGLATAAAGIAILHAGAHPLAAGVALAVVITYVLCYTPLKTRTGLNTLVGAVPGGLPPVLGWAAATGEFAEGTLALFLIMFVWQLPHFLAIAWIYREDYASAALPMLTVIDPDGNRTRRQLVLYSAVLVPVSLYPAMIGMAGPLYFYGALLLSGLFVAASLAMVAHIGPRTARLVLRASLVYLPLLFALMLFDATP